MTVIDLVAAKLTFDGHFAYVWSAWFIGLFMLLVLLVGSRMKRKKLLKQIRFNKLIEQQRNSKPETGGVPSAVSNPSESIPTHQHEEIT